MNAYDVLKYGDNTFMEAIRMIQADEWSVVGATTAWTPKDVVAHLTSYELVLADVLGSAVHPNIETPHLTAMQNNHEGFNDDQVSTRNSYSVEQVQQEYADAHAKVMKLIQQITPETLRENGTIPWYGNEYSLDDYIVYNNYAHKREHAAMMKMFLRQIRK